jgi:hypothetical protein
MPIPRPSFKAARRSKTKDVFMLVGITLPKGVILNLLGSPFHEKRELLSVLRFPFRVVRPLRDLILPK